MSPDDRAKLPPPPCCRLCWHLQTEKVVGVERNECKKGHPMQVGCTWHVERRLTDEERGNER